MKMTPWSGIFKNKRRNTMKFELTRDYAQRMDTEDILAKYKDRFYKLKDTIYMDGNSLGLMSKDAE